MQEVTMGRTLLLTGRPGIGKTTVIKAVVGWLGERAGGFYTEEIRDQGRRKGFRLVALDGQAAVMAHVDLRGKGRPRVSRYGVDVGAIERVGVSALQRAMEEEQVLGLVGPRISHTGKRVLLNEDKYVINKSVYAL